jgi:hypothetical protein
MIGTNANTFLALATMNARSRRRESASAPAKKIQDSDEASAAAPMDDSQFPGVATHGERPVAGPS